MVLCLIVFCIVVCLVSGYFGGYTVDKQFLSACTLYKCMIVRYPWKNLFYFCWDIPNKAALLGIIFELSGLLFSVAITIVCTIQWILVSYVSWLFPMGLLLCHGVVLIVASMVSCVKRHTDYRRIYPNDVRVWIYEFRKAVTASPVICKVEIMALPSQKSDDLYLICRVGRPSRVFRATCATGYVPEIGSQTCAIYKSEYPRFILIPPQQDR